MRPSTTTTRACLCWGCGCERKKVEKRAIRGGGSCFDSIRFRLMGALWLGFVYYAPYCITSFVWFLYNLLAPKLVKTATLLPINTNSLPPPLLLLLPPIPFPRAALLTRNKPPAPALPRVRAVQHVQKRKGEAVIDRHMAMVPVVVPRVVDPWDGDADARMVQNSRKAQKGHVDEEGDGTHGQERRGAVEDAVVPDGLERVDVHVVEWFGRLFCVGWWFSRVGSECRVKP